MLEDLKELQEYFDFSDYVVYEDKLRKQYGDLAVTNAIRSGTLEHRWIPCKSGKKRCVCWIRPTLTLSAAV